MMPMTRITTITEVARKAVAILREQGYVHTVRGMGTFVRARER